MKIHLGFSNISIILLLPILIIYIIYNFSKNKETYFDYLESEVKNVPTEPVNDYKSEGGKYKDLERESGKKKPVTGSCKNDKDPGELCLNYESCCGSISNNCLCKNAIITDCVNMYEQCLENKYLSEKNIDYLGNSNKHKVCNNILKNCCSIVKDMKFDSKYKKVNMKYGDGSNEICGIEDGTVNMCQNMCSMNKDCTSFVFENIGNKCTIYKGELKDKQEVYKDGDKNYQQFVKEGFTSGEELDGTGVCINYNERCANTGKLDENKDACICNHSITQDCKKQYDKCLKKEIEGLTNNMKKKYCKNMFGSCCQAINNIDVAEKFKYEEPTKGFGSSSNLLCHDEGNNITLQECQTRCINNPDCTFIETNTGLSYRGDNTLYCGLYKGSPSFYSSGSTMRKKADGDIIYIKKEITEKEKIKEELDEE